MDIVDDFLEQDFISLDKLDQDPESQQTDQDQVIPSNVPWSREESWSRLPLVTLHNEILDFCDLCFPSVKEQAMRDQVIEDITAAIHEVWPEAEVCVFGSELTKLALPTSDIDLTCLNFPEEPNKKHLHRVGEILKKKGLIDYLDVIDGAKVPIVKIRHKESQVHSDISFNQPGGMKTGNFVKNFMQKYPPIRPLLIVLKQFMHQRELNVTYTGGVGSFLLQLMVISFMQHHVRNAMKMGKPFQYNLGSLLLEFLELYGKTFNYVTTGISVRNSGSYFNKRNAGCVNVQRPGLICVENPEDPSADVGRNSFKILQIRRVFEHAFNRLSAVLCQKSASSSTILGTIIHPDEALIRRKIPDGAMFATNLYREQDGSEEDEWDEEEDDEDNVCEEDEQVGNFNAAGQWGQKKNFVQQRQNFMNSGRGYQ